MGYARAVCGRYTNTKRPQEIDDRLGIPVRETAGTGRYNIAPTEPVLALVAPADEPQARVLRWGLVPHWSTDLKGSAKLINARLETVATRPAYRALLPHAARRALLVADGYFEWLKPERRGEPRQPFYFQVDGGELFTFAGLWTAAHVRRRARSRASRLLTAPRRRDARRRRDPRPHARDPRRPRLPARLARPPRSTATTRWRCAARWPPRASPRGPPTPPSTRPAGHTRGRSCCARRRHRIPGR